jgi:hypothetical protein
MQPGMVRSSLPLSARLDVARAKFARDVRGARSAIALGQPQLNV